jgi:hypothetical protein
MNIDTNTETLKPKSDIRKYIKGFHIEANLRGLNMPMFFTKTSATGKLDEYMNLADDDVHGVATAIATKLVDYFKKVKPTKSQKLIKVTRSEFQKMFAWDIFTLTSRQGYDNCKVEAIEFFTQLFLNSYVKDGILSKEVTKVRRANESFQITTYTLAHTKV